MLWLAAYFAAGIGVAKFVAFEYWIAVAAAALTVGSSLAIGRVACLLHGCCYGTVTHVPWAWRYPPGALAWTEMAEAGLIEWGAHASAPVHPLPLYFLLLELYLFVGADSYLELDSWRRHEELVHLATLVVLARPGFERALVQRPEGAREARVVFFESAQVDVSSTELRERLRAGERPEPELMAGAVVDYCRKYALYR